MYNFPVLPPQRNISMEQCPLKLIGSLCNVGQDRMNRMKDTIVGNHSPLWPKNMDPKQGTPSSNVYENGFLNWSTPFNVCPN